MRNKKGRNKMVSIAIDGPAGAGKSTIARAASKELGYIYVDTGALYRSIGLYMIRHGISLQDAEAIAFNVENVQIELKFIQGEQRVFLGEEDVSDLIRTPEVSMAASAVSAVPKVRQFLLDLQKDMAKKNNVVMDGRDIGTVVLPNADVKIFLTASAEERAKRRCKELEEKGQAVSYQEVLTDIQQRDYNDSHREIAPLKQAEDAVLLDTSHLDLQQSIQALLDLVKNKLN